MRAERAFDHDFDLTAGFLDAEKAGVDHPRVVEYQQVAGTQKARQLTEQTIFQRCAGHTQQAARAGLIGLSLCQSDPMVVPFGGAEIYYGTNPLAFAAPGEGDDIITFDMATTVQAWGKILDARSRHETIPDSWAVDKNGAPTSDPFAVHALLPAAGPKGYGLMMMIDVLSGILLNLPFGRQVSSMYDNLSQGRELGQLHIVINPDFFSSSALFRQHISETMRELSAITPAPGFSQVYYPGQNLDINEKNSAVNGIEIVDEIYDYLVSDALYNRSYETNSPFAQ